MRQGRSPGTPRVRSPGPPRAPPVERTRRERRSRSPGPRPGREDTKPRWADIRSSSGESSGPSPERPSSSPEPNWHRRFRDSNKEQPSSGAPDEPGRSSGTAAPDEPGKSSGGTPPIELGRSSGAAAPNDPGKSSGGTAPEEPGQSSRGAAPNELGGSSGGAPPRIMPKKRPQVPRDESESNPPKEVPEPKTPKEVPEPNPPLLLVSGKSWLIADGGAVFIGNVGPFGPAVFLGTWEAARSESWLKHVNVGVLVRCKKNHRPNHTGVQELDGSFVDTDKTDAASLKAMARDLIHLSGEINDAADNGSTNVLFWCQKGRHRSAAVLAAYLLVHSPGLSADCICRRIQGLKPDVQFLDEVRVVGRHPRPPLLSVLRMMDNILLEMWTGLEAA